MSTETPKGSLMKVQCNNCDWSGEDTDEGFTPVGLCCDLTERLHPGEEVPAGDCPECRAFCHIVRDSAATPLAVRLGSMENTLRAISVDCDRFLGEQGVGISASELLVSIRDACHEEIGD